MSINFDYRKLCRVWENWQLADAGRFRGVLQGRGSADVGERARRSGERFMNWRGVAAIGLGACVACSKSPTVPSNTLALFDGAGETISMGRVTLTAKSSATPYATPGGGGGGPGIGVDLEFTKSPPDAINTLTTPMVTCVDVRLYTQPSGGSPAYSHNQALSLRCASFSGGSSGPSGFTEGGGYISALLDSEVVPKIAPGTYFIRVRVTFPDSSVAEVRAGTIGRG
jgi:hypothetical protein